MERKVVNAIHSPDRDLGVKVLEEMGATIVNGAWQVEDDLIANTRDADAVLCSGPGQPWTSRVIAELARCRILATPSIGFDRIDVEAATAMGIAVTNVPDYCIDEVSNQAIALLMALHRKILTVDRAAREQAYLTPMNRKGIQEYLHPIHRLRDQTLGIIGFGKIGTAAALKAKGLGMKVVAYDPYVFGAVMKSHGVEPVGFDALLAGSDYVSVHAFLNDETRGMVGERAFRRMKRTAYLINTARGPIVDQQALVRALNEGTIAGAGLDVTAAEPIPEKDPILQCPNAILTAHSGWYSTSADSNQEFWHKAATQVAAALRGEWPLYAVNPQAKQKWLGRWGK